MNIKECASLLAAQDNYLILTHKNPDGDTVMSAAALCRGVRRKNKKAYQRPSIQEGFLPVAPKLAPLKKTNSDRNTFRQYHTFSLNQFAKPLSLCLTNYNNKNLTEHAADNVSHIIAMRF